MLKDMKFFAWEKTVKKRIIGVLCMVICACLLMTGCGLWKLNQDRYLSRTVATVDDDIVVTKEGYLEYRVVQVEVSQGEKTTLDEHKLIAGDTVTTGEIEIDDLVALNENIGTIISFVSNTIVQFPMPLSQ